MNRLASRVLSRIGRTFAPAVDELHYARYYDLPFGSSPRGSRQDYLRLWNDARYKKHLEVDAFEAAIGHAIDIHWFHDLALLTQVVKKPSEICYQHGRLLYSALASYASQHANDNIKVLETGTARGFSSLCMARALKDVGNPGTIVTFDVIPHRIPMYWNCLVDEEGTRTRHELLAEYHGLIQQYLIFHQGDTMRELRKLDIPRVHFAFLDGMHTYKYVVHEFRWIAERQACGDIIVVDDFNPEEYPGVVEAVEQMCVQWGYSKEEIRLSGTRSCVVARRVLISHVDT